MAHGFTETNLQEDQTAQVFVGNSFIDMSTASGTQAITGVGFQPKGIIFHACETNVAGVASWGFTDGTNVQCVRESYLTVAGAYVANPGGCIHVQKNAGNTNRYQATISSMDSDGFTLSWTKTGTPTGNLFFNYMCFA